MPSREELAVPGYEIADMLGRGSFGDVWSATRIADGAEVALKVLRASADDDAKARFRREATVAASIDSEHICRVIEADVRGRVHFIAYEKLEGETMEARLAREGDISLEETMTIVDDVLDGLGAAHAKGVIHRDVKPSNVFLVGAGSSQTHAKLLDFGVAKVPAAHGAEEDGPLLTTRGSTLGSLAYMAPEQAIGAAEAEPRSDLYALGVVAFRALVGRPPFAAQSPATMLALKLDRDAPSLGEVSGMKWPASVETFLRKMLAREAVQRFPNALAARKSVREIQAKLASKRLPRRAPWNEPSRAKVASRSVAARCASKATTVGRW